MYRPRSVSPRATSPGADLTPLRLEPDEVQLLDSALTDPPVATAMRKPWGLCPRHAALESELRAGVAYGSTALSIDLLERAANHRSRLGAASPRRRFTAAGPCLTCERVRAEGETSPLRPITAFPQLRSPLAFARPRLDARPVTRAAAATWIEGLAGWGFMSLDPDLQGREPNGRVPDGILER